MNPDYKISLAPMEGIITYIFRNAYVKHFGAMDYYYTPFITSPNLGRRELQEVDPALNPYAGLIPQILTNNSETFLSITKELAGLGYKTYNLNLGCPSGTVVSKHRGSGLLRYPDELAHFLDNIFAGIDGKISIKTRIGYEDESEFKEILEIFKKFPIDELIVHPRLRMDYYKGPLHMNAFSSCYEAFENTDTKLCYNGDLTTGQSIESILAKYPKLSGVMIGRGILMKPNFVSDFVCDRNQKAAGIMLCDNQFESPSYSNTRASGLASISSNKNGSMYQQGVVVPSNSVVVADTDNFCTLDPLTRAKIRAFMDDIQSAYVEIMSGEKPVLFKLKEIWSYLGYSFTEPQKVIKMVHKCSHLSEYRVVIDNIFNNY